MKHVISSIAAIAMSVCASVASAAPINFASGQQGSQNFSINSALAAALGQSGMDVRVQSYGGSGVFLPMIHAGEVDFAAVPLPEFDEAYKGGASFRGVKLTNLRAVSVLVPLPVGIFVKADSPIKSVADLKGKRLTHGISQQPTLVPNIDGILATAGLKANDVQRVLVPTVSQGVDEFLAGRTDAAFFALSGGKLVEADASVGGVRFISLENNDKALAAMQAVLPTAYIRTVPPRQGQIGVKEPTNTMAYDYMLVAGAHVPDDVVERVAKHLRDNADKLSAEVRVLNGLEKARMHLTFGGLPHHPGAAAYYKKAGIN